MIDLKNLIGEKVEIITSDNQTLIGYIDAFCAAEDNDDFDDEAEDSICLDVDGEGGPIILSSHIKSVKLINL